MSSSLLRVGMLGDQALVELIELMYDLRQYAAKFEDHSLMVLFKGLATTQEEGKGSRANLMNSLQMVNEFLWHPSWQRIRERTKEGVVDCILNTMQFKVVPKDDEVKEAVAEKEDNKENVPPPPSTP